MGCSHQWFVVAKTLRKTCSWEMWDNSWQLWLEDFLTALLHHVECIHPTSWLSVSLRVRLASWSHNSPSLSWLPPYFLSHGISLFNLLLLSICFSDDPTKQIPYSPSLLGWGLLLGALIVQHFYAPPCTGSTAPRSSRPPQAGRFRKPPMKELSVSGPWVSIWARHSQWQYLLQALRFGYLRKHAS